ncbi:MAG: DoxX family protein [Pseudomonadota bacterium]
MDKAASVLVELGRWGLCSLFILGGTNKIANPQSAVDMMAEVGLPAPSILLWAVIALELGGGLLVAAGAYVKFFRVAAVMALVLAAHTLATNVLLHDFWAREGVRAELELSLFFKNIAVMGGLILIAGLYGREAAAC